MTDSKRSEDAPLSPNERIAAVTAGVRGSEEAVRGARDQLDARAWIADLTVANTALGRELGSQRPINGAGEECGYQARREEGISW
jgi:hypothetical protein